MKIGKISESILKRSVFKQLTVRRDEVIVGPHVGEDCAVIELAEDEVFVMSTDPITGAVKDIGKLAVHITVNDLAASGAEPVALMVTALLPPKFSEIALRNIVIDLNGVCEQFNIQVIGGHTEVTAAVNQPILSITGIGKVKKDQVVIGSKMAVGDDIVITKWIGIEGTAIIANEKEEVLKAHYNPLFIDRAKTFGDMISVLPESRVAVAFGVTSMHDITEGGIFGALWEFAACADLGLEVHIDKIPIKQETVEICEYFDLNPYQLISSGSMLISTKDGEGLVKALEAAGILGTVIGKITEGQQRKIIQEDNVRSLERPKVDELYKIYELDK